MTASPGRGGSDGRSEHSSRGTSPALQSPLALRVPSFLHRGLPSGEAATASFVCDALSCWDLEPPSELKRQQGRRVVYTTTGPGDCSVGPPAAADDNLLSDPLSLHSLAVRAQRAADAAERAVAIAQHLAQGMTGEDAAAAGALVARADTAASSARRGADQLQKALVRQARRAAPSPPPDADDSAASAQPAAACRTPSSTQARVARYRSLLLDELLPAAAGSRQRPTAASLLRLLREVMRPRRGSFAAARAGTLEVLACALRTMRRRAGPAEAAALQRCLLQDAAGDAAVSPPVSDAGQAVKAEVLRQLVLASIVQRMLWQQQEVPPTSSASSQWAGEQVVDGFDSSGSFSSGGNSFSTTSGIGGQRSSRGRKTFTPLLEANDLASMVRAFSCSSLPAPGRGGRTGSATAAASMLAAAVHRTRSQAVLGTRLSREVSVLARSHVAATSFSKPGAASPVPALVSPVQRTPRQAA